MAIRRPRPLPLRPATAPAAATPAPSGFTLIELLVVLAVLGLVAALGAPPLLDASARLRVNLAATEAASALRLARMTAVRSRANVAVRFEERGGVIGWAVYGDGDGDGVRSRDIDRGIDPELQGWLPLRRGGGSVRLGFPPGLPPRDPATGRRMDRLDDPIRFGNSDLVSFSAIGTSTPGSLYFTDGKSHLAAVRVFGRTGKVKVIAYDARTETWR